MFPSTPAPRGLRLAGAAAFALILAGCNGGGDYAETQAPAPAAGPTAFFIGGAVAGLTAGDTVVLRNNGGDDVTVSADGTFAFATRVTGTYDVTVARQPLRQDCTVAGGGGTASADVTSVSVTCADYAPFVRRVAGSGAPGSANGNGAAASFYIPGGITIDASGNLYVTEFGNSQLRKITPTGDVSTIASGLANPVGVALGPDGNLYVASSQGQRIFRITPDGTVATFAGSGAGGGTNGNGTAATFSRPYGLAFDNAGNLYVSEIGGHRIRKITPAGDVSTLAGTGIAGAADGPGGSATFNSPYDLTVDSAGVIYVADGVNRKIRRIAADGTVTTYAGTGASGSADGAAAAATFVLPFGITLGPDGALYVADMEDHRLRRISAAGMVSTIAGTGAPGATDGAAATATLNAPAGLDWDRQGNLCFADSSSNLVRKLGR